MLATLGWALLFVVVLGLGFLFRRQTSTLGKEVFGSDHRVRYIPRNWVIEGSVGGRRFRYNYPGSTNFGPAWPSWLFVQLPVSADVWITSESESDNVPVQIKPLIASLRKAEGFDRLELFTRGPRSRVNTMGTVSWLDAGPGIMLRRLTKRSGESQFVKNDVALLWQMADLLQKA